MSYQSRAIALGDELEECARQPVVNLYAFRCVRREFLELMVDHTLAILRDWDEPPEAAPAPPRLIHQSDQPQEIRISNVQLLDSAFGHWSLKSLPKAP